MASGSRPLNIANDAAFPVLNSGGDELTQSLQDGPAFSKLLIGSLETHRQQFAVVVFIATAATASESGVGKQAAPKGHWMLVTDIPEEFRDYWVATDAQTETHVFQEGFLAVHPPSGILVAGSSNRMRAAMTRQLEPYTLHSRLPKDEQVPTDPPHFAAYLKTEGRMRYWLQLLQQARAPQGLPQALQPPPIQVQPMEVDATEDVVAEQHTAHRGGGIPNMVPGSLLAWQTSKCTHLCSVAASHPLSWRPAVVQCYSSASSRLCGYSTAAAHQWPTWPIWSISHA